MMILKNILKVLFIALLFCSFVDCGFAASNGSSGGDTEESNVDTNTVNNGVQDPSFCSDSQGVFSELVKTGRTIFNRLRDLIYVVAGFGIIAVAVGGFFGNLNWKWLGAIVISLVVIATAGELIVLMTGCSNFSSTLITNTLSKPTTVSTVQYNEDYTVSGTEIRGYGSLIGDLEEEGEEEPDYADKQSELSAAESAKASEGAK